MCFLFALLMFVGAYLSTDWRMALGAVALGVLSAVIGWGLFTAYRPTRTEPGRERQYPRITEGDGVELAETGDFENAIVEMAPGVWTHMPMDEAKRLYHDERRK